MKTPATPEILLTQDSAPSAVERAPSPSAPKRPRSCCNFQRWETGATSRNYVAAEQVPAVQQNLEAYARAKLCSTSTSTCSAHAPARNGWPKSKKTPAAAVFPRPGSRNPAGDGAIRGPSSGRGGGPQLEVLVRTALFKPASELIAAVAASG